MSMVDHSATQAAPVGPGADPYAANASRARHVHEHLLNDIERAGTVYVGGTNAKEEARFLSRLLPGLVYVDDYRAGERLNGHEVISTAELAVRATSGDYLINNCTTSPGFDHFSRQADSLNLRWCSTVEFLAPHHARGLSMAFASGVAVYGPSFHLHTLQHLDRYRALRGVFHDALSLRTFDNLINFRLTGDPSLLSRVAVGLNPGPARKDAYVLNAQFFRFSDDETFVDAGAFDGTTSRDFIDTVGGRFRRIFMFEPSAAAARQCEDMAGDAQARYPGLPIVDRVEVLQSGLYSHKAVLSFTQSLYDTETTMTQGALPMSAHVLDTELSAAFVEKGKEYDVIEVPVTTLDEQVGEHPVSFIKFEIEGSEVSALSGALRTIRRDRPKMALSIYHRPQDLELIIEQVLALDLGYRMALRAHNPYLPDAIVLYCWH